MMMHILIIYSKNKFTNLSNINATVRQIGGKERHSPKVTHSGSQNSIHDTFTVPQSAPHEMTSLCLLTFCFIYSKMADSDSMESSTSGAEGDGRLRIVGRDVTNRLTADKQTPNKSKSSTAGAPQIGASYLVRRHDDTCRKLDVDDIFCRARVKCELQKCEWVFCELKCEPNMRVKCETGEYVNTERLKTSLNLPTFHLG